MSRDMVQYRATGRDPDGVPCYLAINVSAERYEREKCGPRDALRKKNLAAEFRRRFPNAGAPVLSTLSFIEES